MSDLIHTSITQLAELIRRRRISPVELLEATCQAIDQHDPDLNAFIALFREESLTRARQAESEIQRGLDRGPLHGIPIALKDIVCVDGTRTTCGSTFFADESPRMDATVVSRLKSAGAIIIGKTNLHEFAFGVTTENPHFGPTANPWDVSRVPGGSSGGSAAAVAAGFCAGALGTDTGGSIRIPSALCGVVGLKPTFGRVSVHGVIELAQSLDCVGPMCRYVRDVALMMNPLAGYDARDVHSENRPVTDYTESIGHPIDGMKAGVPRRHFFENLHPDVEHAMGEAIKGLEVMGVRCCELDLPSVTVAHEAVLTMLMAEAGYFHRNWLTKHPEDYGSDVRELLEAGLALSAADYVKAVRAREVAKWEFLQTFEKVDLIITPTVPVPAPVQNRHDPSGGGDSNRVRPLLTQNTRLFNLLGTPSISVPCGFTGAQLPIGLQISGPWWSEKRLLRVAHAYEQATPWHTMHPPL